MKTSARRKGELIFISVILIIPVLNFLIFWVLVNFNSILYAFQNIAPEGDVIWTMKNFELLVKDLSVNKTLLLALRNTLIFFALNVLLVLPVSYVMCYFIYKKIACYKFFRFVFYLPSIISAAILVVLFKQIISPKGPIGMLFHNVNGYYFPFLTDPRYALKTIIFYTVFTGFGSNIVLLSGAMSQIDQSIMEAGRVDGVGMFRELFNLVIPLTWPTLSTLIMFAFVGIFGSSGPMLLFTKGEYNTKTISYWIYEQVYYSGSYYYPSAVGLVCTLIGLPIALGIRKLNSKIIPDVELQQCRLQILQIL